MFKGCYWPDCISSLTFSRLERIYYASPPNEWLAVHALIYSSMQRFTCFCAIAYGRSLHNCIQKVYILSRSWLPWPVLPLHYKRMLWFFLYFLLQFLKYPCSEIEFKKLSKNRNEAKRWSKIKFFLSRAPRSL